MPAPSDPPAVMPSDLIPGPSAAAAVALRGVRVRYDTVTALDDVTFQVPQGSITGLVGRNGAGKTTAIRLLAGLLRAESGEVEVLGKRVEEAAEEIRRTTGFLLSDPALFAYLTPVETLRFLAEAYGLPAAEARRREADLVELLELTAARDRLVEGFSTGMLKRLALGAALVHAPRLLVLDEPFESLDPLIVRTIKRLFVQYVSDGGTVLLSSHLIHAVDEICDRVVILDRGQVVVEGPTSAVRAGVAGRLEAATLEELYASVVEAGEEITLPWLRPCSE
jgi:ABC-2 type transport system ATP-binding protein